MRTTCGLACLLPAKIHAWKDYIELLMFWQSVTHRSWEEELQGLLGIRDFSVLQYTTAETA